MKIYLARHGQSEWQITRDDTNWNSVLTDLGQQQAERLANWLATHDALDQESRIHIGQIWASPLQRAQQTAVPSASALNIPLATDEALHESDFYIAEHLPSVETPYQARTVYKPTPRYAPFKKQARTALHNLAAAAEESGEPVLAISHGGLISTLLRYAVDSDHVSFWLYNTSLNLIEWKRGRWHLVFLNLWDHLPPGMRTF